MTAADDRAAQIRARLGKVRDADDYSRSKSAWAFSGHAESDVSWLLAERDELLRRVEQAEHARAVKAVDEQVTGRCAGTLGSRPWWMSEGQYDPCCCKKPAGHEGEHACEHTDPTLSNSADL